MGTIWDYVTWRGDLELARDPFNEIDALLLSMLSYVDLKGAAPEAAGNDSADDGSAAAAGSTETGTAGAGDGSAAGSTETGTAGVGDGSAAEAGSTETGTAGAGDAGEFGDAGDVAEDSGASLAGSLSLKEVSDRFFELHSEEELKQDKTFVAYVPELMRQMAGTRRFGDVRVCRFLEEIDETKSQQLAAVTFVLPDDSWFVSYRGTDDRIIGWKEDFFLASGIVEAQHGAAAYLTEVCRAAGAAATHSAQDGSDAAPRSAQDGNDAATHSVQVSSVSTPSSIQDGSDAAQSGGAALPRVRAGGHSKGGNLAVYAAAFCDEDVREMVQDVYCFDGPGFREEIVSSDQMQAMAPRISRFIPESALVGVLLDHAVPAQIVKSTNWGVMQHDAQSWEVSGPQFVYAEERSKGSILFDETMREWLEGISDEERTAYINDFFAVLEAPGYETFSELQNGGLKALRAMYVRQQQLDPKTREITNRLLRGMISKWTGQLLS